MAQNRPICSEESKQLNTATDHEPSYCSLKTVKEETKVVSEKSVGQRIQQKS